MLEKSPGLRQAQVEGILKATALPIPPRAGVEVFDISQFVRVTWGADATGAGLVQAAAAVDATP